VYDFSENGASLLVYTENAVTGDGLEESMKTFGLICGGRLLPLEMNDIQAQTTEETDFSPSKWLRIDAPMFLKELLAGC